VFNQAKRRDNSEIPKGDFFDGDPTIIGLTDVGSDVDTGNAEICLVTANSLEQFSN
jgi:hypothetical protein